MDSDERGGPSRAQIADGCVSALAQGLGGPSLCTHIPVHTRGGAGGSPEPPLAPGRTERHPQGRKVHLTEIGYAYTRCLLGSSHEESCDPSLEHVPAGSSPGLSGSASAYTAACRLALDWPRIPTLTVPRSFSRRDACAEIH